VGIPGRLTIQQFGTSMPVDAPAYPRPPYAYRDAELVVNDYVTDADAAAALLPASLELTDEPTVELTFARYPWSTLGPYNEVIVAIKCTRAGEPYKHAVVLYVDSDTAQISGRELAGFPKKMARITIEPGAVYGCRLERPAGVPLCTAVFQPAGLLPVPLPATSRFTSLRVLPDPERPGAFSLAELVETDWIVEAGEVFGGTGSCQLAGASALDPLHRLPIRRPLASMLMRCRMTVAGTGRILERL
jgi:acetoacetate decarboxylase